MQKITFWHKVRLSRDVVTPGISDHDPLDYRWGIPAELRGKTVLDVGTWDGLFAFECERRGADVTAIDVPEEQGGHWGGQAGFDFCYKQLQSEIEFRFLDVTRAGEAGQFDLVLCYGVIYHVTDMLGSIRGLAAATKPGGTLLLETAIWNGEVSLHNAGNGTIDEPCMIFRPNHQGDHTNYFYANEACLRGMLVSAGFEDIDVIHREGTERITLKATRKA